MGPQAIANMQERHLDSGQYFREQAMTTEKYVIPYISEIKQIRPGMRVLEIGCGEGGNLKPFIEAGCESYGIDYMQDRIDKASQYFDHHPQKGHLHLICDDIYNRGESDGVFDVIIMRDVIEHIHDQVKFMGFVKKFMNEQSVFFLAFPPWYNPFGGHQQICKNKFLSKLPFFHILPRFIYRSILKLGGEDQKTIVDLLEIKQTGISLERFERILHKEHFKIKKKTLYFINPNYEAKFGLRPRVQSKIFTSIPFVRNFAVTAGYYVLSK